MSETPAHKLVVFSLLFLLLKQNPIKPNPVGWESEFHRDDVRAAPHNPRSSARGRTDGPQMGSQGRHAARSHSAIPPLTYGGGLAATSAALQRVRGDLSKRGTHQRAHDHVTRIVHAGVHA